MLSHKSKTDKVFYKINPHLYLLEYIFLTTYTELNQMEKFC